MGCVNNYYLVVIKVVVKQACSGDDLTSLPKNKAAFSLSSHLGLDWSFRTTASPVVHRHLRVRGTSRDRLGSSLHRVRRAQRSELLRVFISGHLYFELRCLGSSLLRVRYLGLSLHSGRVSNQFEFLRMRELGRPRAGSSDALPTNQEQAVLQQPISLSGYTKFKKLPKPCFSCPGSPTGLKSKVLKVIWSAR